MIISFVLIPFFRIIGTNQIGFSKIIEMIEESRHKKVHVKQNCWSNSWLIYSGGLGLREERQFKGGVMKEKWWKRNKNL